jgi:hypothetical protein
MQLLLVLSLLLYTCSTLVTLNLVLLQRRQLKMSCTMPVLNRARRRERASRIDDPWLAWTGPLPREGVPSAHMELRWKWYERTRRVLSHLNPEPEGNVWIPRVYSHRSHSDSTSQVDSTGAFGVLLQSNSCKQQSFSRCKMLAQDTILICTYVHIRARSVRHPSW